MTDAQRLAPEHDLARQLIRCKSITPHEGGALDTLSVYLESHQFIVKRLPFGEGAARIDNLFARYDAKSGNSRRHFCFAGHSDVVPPGKVDDWQHDPFSGTIKDGMMTGRGAVDMKGAVAAFAVAATNWIADHPDFGGSISLLITGDEEGPAINGTKPVLDWLAAEKMMPDTFLVGEPTNVETLGDTIKNGRRGSMNCVLTLQGEQGHAAYPHLAENPLHHLVGYLTKLTEDALDEGDADFDSSSIAITSIDTGNPAANVTPSRVVIAFNIRFGALWTSESLVEHLKKQFDAVEGDYALEWRCSAEPFITKPGKLTSIIASSVHQITAKTPQLSTSGGTSDARFIAPFAEVVEFGLVGKTMHKINEAVAIDDLTCLKEIYYAVLGRYFDLKE